MPLRGLRHHSPPVRLVEAPATNAPPGAAAKERTTRQAPLDRADAAGPSATRPWVTRHKGTTRTVWLVGRWAVKLPSPRPVLPHRPTRLHAFVRGWVANLSEWRFRGSPGVCAPRWTVLGLVQVYPRATVGALVSDETGDLPPAQLFPAPPGLSMDRTWPNLGTVDPDSPTAVWVDYDQTDQNR